VAFSHVSGKADIAFTEQIAHTVLTAIFS